MGSLDPFPKSPFLFCCCHPPPVCSNAEALHHAAHVGKVAWGGAGGCQSACVGGIQACRAGTHTDGAMAASETRGHPGRSWGSGVCAPQVCESVRHTCVQGCM